MIRARKTVLGVIRWAFASRGPPRDSRASMKCPGTGALAKMSAGGPLAWGFWGLLAFASFWSTSAEATPAFPHRSSKKRAGKTFHLARTLSLDLDGDGRPEKAAIERDGEHLTVVIFRREGSDEEPTFQEMARSTPAEGRIERFEERPMCGSTGSMLVAVVESVSPDERKLSMRILGFSQGVVREVLAHTLFVPRVRNAGQATDETLPPYRFVGSEDGCEQVVFVEGSQILNIPGRKGPEAVVVGAYQSVFHFDAEAGQYTLHHAREAVDLVPPRPPRDVEATEQVPQIWGTAQAFWATDGRLDTSWNLVSRRARGQRLSVGFQQPVMVSMVRVVPGCAADAASWDQHDRIRSFSLLFDEGRHYDIDRQALGRIPSGVRAIGEFPLARGYGSQVIIVLEEAVSVRSAQFEIRALESAKGAAGVRSGEACLAELSFH